MQWRDDDGVGALRRDEAMARLAGAHVGFLGFTVDALPAVVPVSCGLVGERMVIRTARGGVLVRAVPRSVVSVLVCDLTPELDSGWCVTITGIADVVHDPAEIAACERVGMAGSPGDVYLGLSMDLVTARAYAPRRPERVET
jgi:hypothetical protein